MKLTTIQVENIRRKDGKRQRILLGTLFGCLILMFLFSLCFRVSEPGFISPICTFQNLFTALKLFLADVFHNSYSLQRQQVLTLLPDYEISLARLRRTIIFCLSGMGVSLAGAIFQNIYKNPMASPNIIGATVGVKLGNVLMITLYGGAALYLPLIRYRYCYIFTALIVFGVLLLGKVAGGKKTDFAVIEMVMAGSVISQAFSVVTMYMMYNLDDDALLAYQTLTMGTSLQTDGMNLLIFVLAMAVSLIPMYLLRFRMNGAGFTKAEGKVLGIRVTPLRIGGQLCGVIMVTAAMIHCGDVGMISMAIPHLARYLVGADFKKVSVCSMLCGGILLMGCRIVSSLIYINGNELPVNFLISLCIMPVFLVVLARQRRGFE